MGTGGKIYRRFLDLTRRMDSINIQKILKWVFQYKTKTRTISQLLLKNDKELDFVSCHKYSKLFIYNWEKIWHLWV